jgi:hypothetical protein
MPSHPLETDIIDGLNERFSKQVRMKVPVRSLGKLTDKPSLERIDKIEPNSARDTIRSKPAKRGGKTGR